MIKKLLSLLLAVLLFISVFAACGQSNAANKDGKKDSGPDKKYDKKLVVSMNVLDAEKSGKNAKVDYYKEKFNLEFKYIPVTWGDWGEKIRAWIAADDAPDLIWWDLKGGTSNEYRSWAKQGAFKEMPDFKDYPNLNKVRETMKSDEALVVDSKLYAWPAYRNVPPDAKSTYFCVMAYRRDWAKKLGLYKEGDVYTWTEYISLLKAIVEKDPGGNGQGNTAGITSTPWGFPNSIALFFMAPESDGNEGCDYIIRDGKYVWPPALPEFKEAVKWTWQMYKDGLVWKDQMNAKGSEGEDKFKAGQSAFFYGNNGPGEFNKFRDDMTKSGILKDRQDIGVAFIQDPKGNFWMQQTEDYWTVTAFNHKISKDKVDRILDFWDWLNTEEGTLFRQVGILDKDYRLEDGKAKVLWPNDPKTGFFASPYNEASFNEFVPASLTPGPNPADRMEGWEEAYRVWDYMKKGTLKLKPFDYDVAFFSAPNKDKYGSLNMDAKAKLMELMVSSSNIEADWDAWVKSMMPKVELVLAELNNGIKK
jgi:putative aldouronate transport system substrate-binding protein